MRDGVLVVNYSRSRSAGLLVLVLVLLAAAIAGIVIAHSGFVTVVLGTAGLLLALLAVRLVYLAVHPTPAFVLDDDGLHSFGVVHKTTPWDQIQAVEYRAADQGPQVTITTAADSLSFRGTTLSCHPEDLAREIARRADLPLG